MSTTNLSRFDCLLTAFVTILSVNLLRAAVPAEYSSVTEQWGIEEITFHSKRTFANPFVEVTLAGRFMCSGTVVEVPGFHDGGDTWRIRFMPEAVGACTFTTISNNPDLAQANGKFTVSRPSPGNHGPVRVAKTYHFSYSDGTPYFLLGTTLYNWVNRDEALRKQTLQTLSKNPFTKIRFCLFPKWYEFNRVDPQFYPYEETSPHTFNFDRFDPRFFQMVEAQLLALQKLQIEADIILFHPYDRWGFAGMDAEHDDAYIRYTAARFSAFRNVWWTMANEYDLFNSGNNADSPARKSKAKDWDRLFQTLEASDPFHHLRGIHNFSHWYDHGKPWITHVIIQDGGGARVPKARGLYHKPGVVDELGYEGNNGNRWGKLSGAEEVSRIWDVTMQGGYASHGETYVHPGGILWWAAGGTLTGESPARLAFLREIMAQAPFQDLVPLPESVQGGDLLALDGQYYLLHVKNPPARLDALEVHLKEDRLYKVDLIDPWLMKIYPLGITSGGLQAFATHMAPCVLRFTRMEDSAGNTKPVAIHNLIAKFLDDPTSTEPPRATPIRVQPAVYGAGSALWELMDNPATAALVKQYMPRMAQSPSMLLHFTLEDLIAMGPTSSLGDVPGLVNALHQIPLEWKR